MSIPALEALSILPPNAETFIGYRCFPYGDDKWKFRRAVFSLDEVSEIATVHHTARLSKKAGLGYLVRFGNRIFLKADRKALNRFLERNSLTISRRDGK